MLKLPKTHSERKISFSNVQKITFLGTQSKIFY